MESFKIVPKGMEKGESVVLLWILAFVAIMIGVAGQIGVLYSESRNWINDPNIDGMGLWRTIDTPIV